MNESLFREIPSNFTARRLAFAYNSEVFEIGKDLTEDNFKIVASLMTQATELLQKEAIGVNLRMIRENNEITPGNEDLKKFYFRIYLSAPLENG